jgi:hypothetical protein
LKNFLLIFQVKNLLKIDFSLFKNLLKINKMSIIMNNKTIIHIVSEVVVIIGVLCYIRKSNSNFSKILEDLEFEIASQKDIIKSHQDAIMSLIKEVEQLKISHSKQDKNLIKKPILKRYQQYSTNIPLKSYKDKIKKLEESKKDEEVLYEEEKDGEDGENSDSDSLDDELMQEIKSLK